MILQICYIILGINILALADPVLDTRVSAAIIKPSDVNQQKQMLLLLPTFFGHPDEWNALLDHLHLDLLDSSHCGMLARTALQLERAYELNLGFVSHLRQGGRVDPHALITNRIRQLVFPDMSEFDEVNHFGTGNLSLLIDADVMKTAGTINDFWAKLLTWADQKKIDSLALDQVRTEINAFRAEAKERAPAANDAYGLRDAPRPPQDQKVTNPTRDVGSIAVGKPPTPASRSWTMGTLCTLAAIGLVWLLLKKRS